MRYRRNSPASPTFSGSPQPPPTLDGEWSPYGVARELDRLWLTLQSYEERLRAVERQPDSSWEGAVRHHGWEERLRTVERQPDSSWEGAVRHHGLKVLLGALALLLSKLGTGTWPGVSEVVSLLSALG